MKFPHFILEMANVHGGSVAQINRIIEKFSNLQYENLGIKFQPFKYDKIALSDYSWYETYKQLFINEDEWSEIISLANKNYKAVWLDLFDAYGVQILKNYIDQVYGIKLQSSVLGNNEVFNALSSINTDRIKLIINISGYDLNKIKEISSKFRTLNVSELIIQIGYQSYPTNIDDTGINKISVLKDSFPSTKICFADHLPFDNSFSKRVPLVALAKGCEYIEKHICLDREKTKFDFYSALEYDDIEDILIDISNIIKSHSNAFIPDAEIDYFNKTLQKPVLKTGLKKNQLVANEELVFRRTDKKGITSEQIFEIQSKFSVIKNSLDKHSTLKISDFTKAKIGVITACRMKSSRLKKKASLLINGIPSVERCLQNCLMIPFANIVVLATSTLKEDSILENHIAEYNVRFWQGDPDDVIQRYIEASEYYDIDVIIRVTADMPVVSPEIAEYLLKSHFAKGADYTCAGDHAPGSAVQIINLEALKRVIQYLGKAEYSEYMTFYMENNPNIFKINKIDLPA